MDGGTTFSVTFAELATRLGITVPSAKNLVRRKRWSRHAGNNGLTRITVPVAYVEENASTDTGTDVDTEIGTETSTSAGTDTGIHLAALAALERTISRLESEVASLKTERDVLASMPEQVAALKATLEAVTDERDRLLTREHLREQRRWWPFLRSILATTRRRSPASPSRRPSATGCARSPAFARRPNDDGDIRAEDGAEITHQITSKSW
jgi:hypothetical protein